MKLRLAVAVLAYTASAVSPADLTERPNVKAYPFSPGKPFPISPPRTKQCRVEPSGTAGKNDAPAILKAFRDCNDGGTVILDANYTIASPLDLTFLNHVDVALTGTVSFSDDVDYWVGNTFKYTYQISSSMWRIGGKDVNIFGHGVGIINGNGQKWYDRFATNDTLQRPILVVIDGLDGGSITGLKLRQTPNWNFLCANSSNVIFSDIDIAVKSKSTISAKNTDGWDTYRSNNIVIQNSVISNGDDCVSFKPNSTDIVVQGLVCDGSHGISVGSLGQYPASFDIVSNVYVYNISMSNASDGARIKVWPGIDTPFQPTLSGGGGSGYVKNITYNMFNNQNNDWAIELTQCYGQSNQTLCDMYPSKMVISDINFNNFWGTTSKKYDPKVGTLICSSPDVCSNISAQNITVRPPSGKGSQWICKNISHAKLGINCVSS